MPNNLLLASRLPSREADWQKIVRFCLTFEGYKLFGSVEDLARIDREGRCGTLSEMRARLFFKQRKHRWNETEPDAAEMVEIRDLLDQIAQRVALAGALLA